MAERVREPRGRIMVILVILFDLTIIRKIDGYILKSPESIREPRDSSNGVEKDGPVPSCTNSTFCEETPYYPSVFVANLLSDNKDLKYLATVDAPLDVLPRIDYTRDGVALCRSQEMVVTPKTALSKGGRWLYVVNYEEYVQAVRVEVCTPVNRACRIIDGFMDGYKSTCKQTYIYRQMIAITSDGRVAPQLFKLPASLIDVRTSIIERDSPSIIPIQRVKFNQIFYYYIPLHGKGTRNYI